MFTKASNQKKSEQAKKTTSKSFIKSQKNQQTFITPVIQTKLAIGNNNDVYEKEADAMAEKIVAKNNDNKAISKATNNSSIVQKKVDQEKEEVENIQLKTASAGNVSASSGLVSTLKASKGNGHKMSDSVKTEMESGFGNNFDSIRIHTGTKAVQMNHELGAKAFTNGNHIYFNTNNYNPNTTSGKKLLAHELTHVVQQKQQNSVIQKKTNPAKTPVTNNTQVTKNTIDAAKSLGGQFVTTATMTATRIGPIQSMQDVFIIVGPTTKIENIAKVLLPLWNTAKLFTAEGSTTPVPRITLTADELAKGLLAYNRYKLAIPPATNPPIMRRWKIGMSFPLPIRIDKQTGEGVLHPLQIQANAKAFDPSWKHLLTELPKLLPNTKPADITKEATEFLKKYPKAMTRGIALMAKATQNAIANEQLILEILKQSGKDAFDIALGFMSFSVNKDFALLKKQKAGARILAAMEKILGTPPTTVSKDVQDSLERKDNMFGLTTAIDSEYLTTWEDTQRTEREVYVMRLLIDNYGFPVNGAAGLVGNLYSESGVLPNRIEGSSMSEPMKARNFKSKKVTFTPQQVKDRDYSKKKGPKKPGIGLAQWTSKNRRDGLYDHSFRGRKDDENIVYNLEAQVDYLVTELQGSYKRVYKVLTKKNVSVDDASDEVIYNFEIPGSILSGKSKLPRTNAKVIKSFENRRKKSHSALKAYKAALPKKEIKKASTPK